MSKPIYLVGVDGSDWSRRAVERAVNIAKATEAQVKLLYVLDWPSLHPAVVGDFVPPPIDEGNEEGFANQNIIQPILAEYAESDVFIEGELVWGEPVNEIHKKAKDLKANMVFLGRRGRSTFSDLLLGSVANKLAHHLGVPIVLVP